jgi:hypothetical protein
MAFNRLLQIDKLEKLYETARIGGDFSRDLLGELAVDLRVSPGDLNKIPKTGPAIAVANHPFGLLDGAIMADLPTRVRPDIRVLTNHLRAVTARRPMRGDFIEKWEMQALYSLLPDVEELSAPASDLEPDGKGIPILVKRYVKPGGRLPAFSVDPQFGDTPDGFVVVDLRNTPAEVLGRYMTREGARSFFAWHQTLTPRVA